MKLKMFCIFTIVLLLLVSFQPMVASLDSVGMRSSKDKGVDVKNSDQKSLLKEIGDFLSSLVEGEKEDNSRDTSSSHQTKDVTFNENSRIGDRVISDRDISSFDMESIDGLKPVDPTLCLPDLLGCWFNVTSDLLIAGDLITFWVEFTINNTGCLDTGSFNVSFYISKNGHITTDDKFLFRYFVPSLTVGGTIEDTIQLPLPQHDDDFWVGDGFYYIGMIVDSHNDIEETNETNNANRGWGLDYEGIIVENTSVTPYNLDLDVDANNNEGINFPERSAEEDDCEVTSPGKYVIWNVDNDNGERIPDILIDGIIAEENDLAPLVLEIMPSAPVSPGTNLNYKFVNPACGWSDYVRLWKSSIRGNFINDEVEEDNIYQYDVRILGDVVRTGILDDWDENQLDLYIDNNEYDDAGDMNCDGVLDLEDLYLFRLARDNNITRYVPLKLWMEGLEPKGISADDGLIMDDFIIKAWIDFDGNGFNPSEDDEIDEALVTVCSLGVIHDADYRVPGIPIGYNGNDPDPQSKGWRYEYYAEDVGGGSDSPQYISQQAGYPLNLALGQGPTPPDFPPISTDPSRSSSPLLSREVSYFQGPTPYVEQPTHNNVISMITGQPVIQENDFELPFGGATFRYIRTYSEPNLDLIVQRRNAGFPGLAGAVNEPAYDDARSAYWDWVGRNWMVSFNPFLLVDAGYDELGNFNEDDNETRYCYFIGDAHHTVPFEYNKTGNGQYISPNSFDGILLHNGNDAQQPTEFYLYQNENSIKYTFKVLYEDVEWQYVNWDDGDPLAWIDTHDPLPGPSDDDGLPDSLGEGWGFPSGYGLVEKIEDRYGNTVEYEYFDDFNQWECDNPDTPEIIEVCQNVNKKGQLRSIKLRTANDEVAWTLLFVHRSFSAKYDDFPLHWEQNYTPRFKEEVFNPTMIHAVYVYDYDLDTSQFECLTLGSNHFTNLHSFDDYDHVDAIDLLDLPEDWIISSKNMYEEADPHYYTEAPADTPYRNYSLIEDPGSHPWDEWGQAGFNLLKTTVTKQFTQPDGTKANESQQIIYRYEHYHRYEYSLPQSNGRTYLEAVFYDTAIDTVVNAKKEELNYDVSENIIFELKDDNITIIDDPETGEEKEVSLLDFADLNMSCWSISDASGNMGSVFYYDDDAPDPDTDLFVNLTYLIAAQLNKTWVNPISRKTMIDNRADSDNNGMFTYYLLKTYPVDSELDEVGNTQVGLFNGWFHTEYHYPYRCQNYPDDMSADYELIEAPWDEPFFNFIIDEQDPENEYDPIDEDRDGEVGILSRRVVQMNPAGWILSDRTWVNVNGSLVLNNRTGFYEEWDYDSFGRPVQKRTWGWTSPENIDLEHDGMIKNYNYSKNRWVTLCSMDGSECNQVLIPGRIRALSVQMGNGSNQIPYCIKCWNRSYDGRPELVSQYVEFPDPIPLDSIISYNNWDVNEENIARYGDVTDYSYEFDGVPTEGNGYFELEVCNKNKILPAVNQTLGGPDVRAAGITIVDECGNVNWSGYGNIIEESDGTIIPAENFFLNYKGYDSFGRVVLEVVDADDNYFQPPNGLFRNSSSTEPLNLTTEYFYNDWGMNKIIYPDKSEKHIVYKEKQASDGEYYTYQWVYDKIIWHGDEWEAPVPVTITQIDNYMPVEKWDVCLNDTRHWGVPSAEEPYKIISNTKVKYDSSGRPISGTKTEGNDENSSSISGHVSYHASGKEERKEGSDGTITRYQYNGMGYLERTYQGTNDTQPVWGNADPWDSSDWNDNLVLLQKRSYGNGTNDAGKLVEIRHYRNLTSNQYFLVNPSGEFDPEPNEDEIGFVERYKYDWRMREVCRQYCSTEGMPLKHEFTWLDNLDRGVLNAVYGSEVGIPVHVDPRTLGAGWTLTRDNITAILTSVPLPLSLTETIYNARGQTQEVRTYDVLSGEDANYTSTMTFYDHNGNAVETYGPNSPKEISVYDAKNRLITSSSLVPVGGTIGGSSNAMIVQCTNVNGQSVDFSNSINGEDSLVPIVLGDETPAGYVEITRTETIYDSNDRAIKTISWERMHNATGSFLTDQNSVKTYSYTWYDEAGRVNVTASYGTNNASHVYSSGPEPFYDENNPPVPGVEDGVLVTQYEYDEKGNQNKTITSDGTATSTECDGLGRKILVTENADASNLYMRRHTAYHYDDAGRMDMMAAVLPQHDGLDGLPGIANWSDIDWDATDGTLQITKMYYGADVVDDGDPEMLVLGFDGIDDYVDTDDEPFDMDQTNRFTISAWIKTSDSNCKIVSKFNDSLPDKGGYELGINEDGKLLLQAMIYSTAKSVVGTTRINDNQWHHVVGTYGGIEHGLHIFVDGKEDNKLLTQTFLIYKNDLTLQIGRRADAGFYFNGTMNEVRVYNRSLSIKEIFVLYRGSHVTNGLKGYWKMNEGEDVTVYDDSGEDNNGNIYGATWATMNKRPISTHNGWISKVCYPNNETGQPDPEDFLKFTYYMDGSVASRIDSKGTTFYYVYDELGQIIETIVDDSSYYNPDGSGEPDWTPQNRVRNITYEYEADGQLSAITTYNATGDVISQNTYAYDGMRNLVKEWQAHGSKVDAFTPVIEYNWETISAAVATGNVARLKSIIYPIDERTISFNYNGGNGIDNALSRVSNISVTGIGTVSEYEYVGLSRRVNMTLGEDIINQCFVDSDGIGYNGLDQFGRVKDLHFKNDAGTLHRYQYGYDENNNRIYANVTQCDPSGIDLVNDRSFLYQYDALNRLVNASMGRLDANNQNILLNDPESAPLTRLTEWNLDNLGNWAGGNSVDGSMIQEDIRFDGTSIYKTHHDVNSANQIIRVNRAVVEDDSPPTYEEPNFVYDRVGNLVFDNEYFYQYDAFNRLIQVNQNGSLNAGDFDEDGRIKNSMIPGDLIVRYTYDGIGRLIRKETPTTTEDYYYDGVRRIQELVTGAGLQLVPGGSSGSGGQGIIHGTVAGSSYVIGNSATVPIFDSSLLQREYIYGPDYIDEFIGQIDQTGDMYYMLQDANYNVMALVNDTGIVVEQYVYDPYGTLAIVDTFPGGENLMNRVGHQGLFFERFDDPDGKPLSASAVGLYYNRNRWYSPTLGRFLSRDPNEAAMPIYTALAMNGDIIQLVAHMYSLQGQYGDGMNLYQYCGSNPVNNRDPSGLVFDPLEFVLTMVLIQACKLAGELVEDGAELYHKVVHFLEEVKYLKIGFELFEKMIEYIEGNAGGAGQVVGRILQECKAALGAIRSGTSAFFNALVRVGRIAGPWLMKGLRFAGAAGTQVLLFLESVIAAALPFMAIMGVFVLAGYAGYKLGQWLSPIIDELGDQLWNFYYDTAMSRAKAIVAPVMQAAANYATQLDLVMYELETGQDVSPYV